MAMRNISPEAKKRISEAAKKRWAAYRAAKAAGKPVAGSPKSAWTPAKRAEQSRKIRLALAARRRGRPPKAAAAAVVAAAPTGEFSGLSLDQLVSMRRRIDQELADRLVRGQA